MEDPDILSSTREYPKSKNNHSCIGPCYEPNTWIVHPITLDYVTDNVHPFCPTNEWFRSNAETGKKSAAYTDICNKPTDKEDIHRKDLELNMLLPHIDYNCTQFLKLYYKINTFEESISWIKNNKHTPINTQLRIIDCSLKAWGQTDKDVNILSNQDLIEFLINDVVKKYWIKDIYNKVKKYIHISLDDNKISLKKKEKSKEHTPVSDKHRIQKINFIMKKFITANIFYRIMSRYLDKFKNDWQTIDSHTTNIKNEIINYILYKTE